MVPTPMTGGPDQAWADAREAGPVVPVDVAPRDVPMSDGALREKFVPKISEILKI